MCNVVSWRQRGVRKVFASIRPRTPRRFGSISTEEARTTSAFANRVTDKDLVQSPYRFAYEERRPAERGEEAAWGDGLLRRSELGLAAAQLVKRERLAARTRGNVLDLVECERGTVRACA